MTASRSGGRIVGSRTAIPSMEYFPTFAPTDGRDSGTPIAGTVCRLRCQAKHRSRPAEPASRQKDFKMPGSPPAAQPSLEFWRLETAADTWNAYDTPFVSNANAGALSVAFRDPWHGIVGGGDLTNDSAYRRPQRLSDGGQTMVSSPPSLLYSWPRSSCLAYVRGIEHKDDWWNDRCPRLQS